MYQVLLINGAIANAKAGSPLHSLPLVADPSNEIVAVLIQCMDWNIASRQTRIPESELLDLQQKSTYLLDLLQQNLPYKTGERASGILKRHTAFSTKVCKIVLWGNSDNTSCQAPEVCTPMLRWAIYVLVCTIFMSLCTVYIKVSYQYVLCIYMFHTSMYLSLLIFNLHAYFAGCQYRKH
jgi:hypothetical protein